MTKTWTVALTTTGVLAAALIYTLTRDVIWTATALLLTFVIIRRVLQHHSDPRPKR